MYVVGLKNIKTVLPMSDSHNGYSHDAEDDDDMNHVESIHDEYMHGA